MNENQRDTHVPDPTLGRRLRPRPDQRDLNRRRQQRLHRQLLGLDAVVIELGDGEADDE